MLLAGKNGPAPPFRKLSWAAEGSQVYEPVPMVDVVLRRLASSDTSSGRKADHDDRHHRDCLLDEIFIGVAFLDR